MIPANNADVLDLRRERAVQKAILEKEECARINNMFQNVVLVIRKVCRAWASVLYNNLAFCKIEGI